MKYDLISYFPLILDNFVHSYSGSNLIIVAFFSELLMFLKVYSLKQSINTIETYIMENGKSLAKYFPLI